MPFELGVVWSGGAPLPHLVSSGHRSLVAFYLEEPAPNWDGTYARMVDPTDDTVESLALAEFKGVVAVKMGPPNDEVLHGHPLWGRGLEWYGTYVVENSRWLAELIEINRVHERFDLERWEERRHFPARLPRRDGRGDRARHRGSDRANVDARAARGVDREALARIGARNAGWTSHVLLSMAVRQATIDRPVDRVQAEAQTGRGWYAVLARTGLGAKGVSYGLVGVLAVALALGAGGQATSRQRALQKLASHSFGKVVLALLALGFAAYAIWRFVQAVAEREDAGDGETKGAAKKWGKRAGYVGRGLIYAGLTASTVKIVLGAGGGGSQTGKAHKTTATVLSWPAGTWLVGIAGAVIVGVGLWNLYRGISRKFEDRWRTGEMVEQARRWGARAGVVGHAARAVVFALIGIFLFKAAIDFNPKDAIGLDGALRKLAHASYGPYLLGLTAAGLVAYALYCFVDARYRDVSAG